MLEHGGNIDRAALQFGIAKSDWLDLSTGVNPHVYPLPEIPAALWQRLPDDNDGLLEAAREFYGADSLLAVSGSQAAIQSLPALRSPCRVAIPRVMYAEHAFNWQQYGHQLFCFDGEPDEGLLQNVEVLVLCNPNNPTGQFYSVESLLSWHAILAAKNGWLLVDEAFMDCTPLLSLCAYTHLPGLIVLRSLGKFFGLAGARVGFVAAQPQLLHRLADKLGPWPIAGPARFVAREALSNTAWQVLARQRLLRSGGQLHDLLASYGFAPRGGCALFQWLPIAEAEHLHQDFAQFGIWLRFYADWSALRFGLPADADWQRLENCLRQLYTHSHKQYPSLAFAQNFDD
jgi:cobalamin biosynthesis protein CobC